MQAVRRGVGGPWEGAGCQEGLGGPWEGAGRQEGGRGGLGRCRPSGGG